MKSLEKRGTPLEPGERPVDAKINQTAAAEHAKRFAEVFGDVPECTITATDAIQNNEHDWVREIDSNGPPTGFNEAGWKPWSATLRAKNFAILQNALTAMNLDSAQRAAVTGYLLNQQDLYDLRTGHADITAVQVTPHPETGECVLTFTYDRYQDVRQNKKIEKTDESLTVSLAADEIAKITKSAFALPGITADGIDQTLLAKSLFQEQRGIGDSKVPRADIRVDLKRGAATVHAHIVNPARTRYSDVPVAVIQADQLFTAAEQSYLKNPRGRSRSNDTLTEMLHTKTLGQSLAEYSNLPGSKKSDRALSRLDVIAGTFAGADLAEALKAKAEKDSASQIRSAILVWQQTTFYEVMKIWESEQKRARSGLSGLVNRIFSGSKSKTAMEERNDAETEVSKAISSIQPTGKTNATVSWVGGYKNNKGDDGIVRADAILAVEVSIDEMNISLPVNGLKHPITLTTNPWSSTKEIHTKVQRVH